MAFTPEDFDAYKTAERAGDTKKARRYLDKMIRANDRLIRMLVRKYGRFLAASIEEADKLQAGYVGCLKMLRRIDKIDPDRHISTLLGFAIRTELNELNAQATAVRRPISSLLPYKIQRQEEAFIAVGDVMPKPDDVTQRKWDTWHIPRLSVEYEQSCDELQGEMLIEDLIDEKRKLERSKH